MRQRNWRKKHAHESILSRHHEPGGFSFILVLDHLKAGYNVGKIIRVGNALGCRELHLVGLPVFDPSPSKGAFKHTRSRVFEDFRGSYEWLVQEGYEIYALNPNGQDILGEKSFSEKTAFVLGHEEYGHSFDPAEFPLVRQLKIPQFGSVQSLNVSIAAGLAAFEYTRQWRVPHPRVPHPVVEPVSSYPGILTPVDKNQ